MDENNNNNNNNEREVVRSSNNDNDSDEQYFKELPVGYRFAPTDEELVEHYLFNKIFKLRLPQNRIREVRLYDHHPLQLARRYKLNKKIESEWYFFTSRDKKYPKGKRPSRKAGEGHWKPTGTDKPIQINHRKIATRKSLDYYQGKPNDNNALKTHWKMHEYVLGEDNLPSPAQGQQRQNNMQLDEWVLCKIYNKKFESMDSEEDAQTPRSNTTSEIGESSNSKANPQVPDYDEIDNSVLQILNGVQGATDDFTDMHPQADDDYARLADVFIAQPHNHLLLQNQFPGLANDFTSLPINNNASMQLDPWNYNSHDQYGTGFFSSSAASTTIFNNMGDYIDQPILGSFECLDNQIDTRNIQEMHLPPSTSTLLFNNGVTKVETISSSTQSLQNNGENHQSPAMPNDS